MQLLRWKPFVDTWDRDFQLMLDRFLGRDWYPSERFEWKPRVDMFRRKGDLIVRVELPGIDPRKELDIEIEDDILHISGERTKEEKVTDEDNYLEERFYGRFERHLMLPQGVEPDKLKATYEDGILTITVPLPAEVLPRAYKVEVKT